MWQVLLPMLVVLLSLSLMFIGGVLGRLSLKRQLGRFVLQLDNQCRAECRIGKPSALVEGPGITAAARAITMQFLR